MILLAAALLALGMLPVPRADLCLELPMMGVKQSLNVATAFGVLGYELVRRFGEYQRSDPSVLSEEQRFCIHH